MMKISHGIEYVAIWSLTRLVQTIPGRLADIIAVLLGKLTFFILASRRRIARENLRRAFAEQKSEKEIGHIIKGVFLNISRTTIEFARQPVFSPKKILDMTISENGREYFDQTLAEGKGVLLVTGHLGNWELLGGWVKAHGYSIDFLVGRQHNQKVNELFISFRKAFGVGIIPVGVAARKVIKALRANHIVGLVSDQHVAAGGTVVNFFGRPAATPKGPAAFAVKVGCPIISGYFLRENYGKFLAKISPPIYPPESGDTEADIQIMTEQYTANLESIIRKYPEQWMWTHRRWKLD